MNRASPAICCAVLVQAMAGCSTDSDSGESQGEPGSEGGAGAQSAASSDSGTSSGPDVPIVLRFQLGGSAASSRNLVDELVGPVYGSIFDAAEVTLTGPAESAAAVESVFVETVDLRGRDVSEAAWEGAVPPGDYTFLGFWDLDGSSADAGNPRPENGDPVPLADTNRFTVEGPDAIEIIATFELIYAFD